MKKHIKGYICGTAPTDIWIDSTADIYPSVKELKKNRSCWKECGILEVNLSKAKTIRKGTLVR